MGGLALVGDVRPHREVRGLMIGHKAVVFFTGMVKEESGNGIKGPSSYHFPTHVE